MKPFISKLKSCARCGKNHRKITWKVFKIPIEVSKVKLTHWGICPKTKEPIILTFVDDKKA